MNNKKEPKSKPRIEKTTPADENNVVHTVVGGKGSYCKTPCAECPWLVENTGNFPAEAFRISASTAYDMAQNTFACHMRGSIAPTTCAGFLLRSADHNLSVRLSKMKGKMLDVTEDNRNLHENYRAMAIAHGVNPDEPCLKPCRD